MKSRALSRSYIPDALICAAAFVVFAGYCILRSPKKVFWFDEVLTVIMVRGMSLGGMLDALRDKINAMPPTYFILVWAWSQAFGTSDLALRLFSSACMAAGWTFCWLLLRTFCSRPNALAALAVTWLCSTEVVFYICEARCYSLYLASFAAAGWLFVLAWRREPAVGLGLPLGAFAANAVLVTSHYIGCFYSAALVGVSALGWVVTRWRPLGAYALGAGAGAGVFALTVPFYLAQRTLGANDNWLGKPDLMELPPLYSFGLSYLPLFILVVLAACAANQAALAIGRIDRPDSPPEDPVPGPGRVSGPRVLGLVCLGSICLIMPAALWVESIVALPLFLPRYLLPSFLAWPCGFAAALEMLSRSSARDAGRSEGLPRSVLRHSPTACCVVLLLLSLFIFRRSTPWPLGPFPRLLGEEIAREVRLKGLPFASRDLQLILQVLHAGKFADADLVKFVRTKPIYKTDPAHSAAIDRRFFPGLVVTPEELARDNQRWLMLDGERKYWIREGIAADKLRGAEPVDPNADFLDVVRRPD